MDEMICIIPARGGSKGIKQKNIKEFCGKPLIAWSILQALDTPAITDVFVTTENANIADVASQYGAKVIDRPKEMATDFSSGVDCIVHGLQMIKKKYPSEKDFVMLHCTSPLRMKTHLVEAIDIYNKTECYSVVSMHKQDKPPWLIYRCDEDGFIYTDYVGEKPDIVRRQDFPEYMKTNGALYIIGIDEFLEEKVFYNRRTIPYPMDELYSIDIDSEYDFKLAEMVYKNFIDK